MEDQNEFISIGGNSTISYDADGNTVIDDQKLIYNAWNMLMQVQTSSGNTTPISSYTYDGLDHRITETPERHQRPQNRPLQFG